MIPITKVHLQLAEEAEVKRVLKSGWIMNGPVTEKFENEVAKYIGSKYAVAVSSGTTALYLSLRALGIKPGDEVITPSYSFVSSAYVANLCGATPVFADVNLRTFNLEADLIRSKITKKTKAVIVVDQFGLSADLAPIYQLAEKYGFSVIEDAACALGSKYRKRKIGSQGDLVCFSFHPRKVITTGEGGMVVTHSSKIANIIRSLRNHGLEKRQLGEKADRIATDSLERFGLNGRITDIQSAIGLAQIKRINEFLRKRSILASTYNKAFADNPYFDTPFIPEYAEPNWQSYAIVLKKQFVKFRNQIITALKDKRIIVKEGIQAIHKQPTYRSSLTLPHTEYLADASILLPIYPTLTKKEQNFIIKTLLGQLKFFTT